MLPLPSNSTLRPPEDFALLLATKEPVLLVGGQAVNIWAMYYESRTISLAPFVSRDVDVLGDRDTFTALGRIAGTKPQFFPMKPLTNEIGVVIAKGQARAATPNRSFAFCSRRDQPGTARAGLYGRAG